VHSGVDLSKIFGGHWANQSIGGKVVKSDKCMGISKLLGGTCPGCPPPKSTPMKVHVSGELEGGGRGVLFGFTYSSQTRIELS